MASVNILTHENYMLDVKVVGRSRGPNDAGTRLRFSRWCRLVLCIVMDVGFGTCGFPDMETMISKMPTTPFDDIHM